MNKTLMALAMVMTGLAGGVQAAGDAVGEPGLEKAFICTGCHGYNGMGTRSAPALAGQSKAELTKKLSDFKTKKSSIMGDQASRLSEKDLGELASYFSSKPKTERGQASYARDIHPIIEWRCMGCHTGQGKGVKVAGLDLGSYEGLMKGTKHGGSLIKPGSSLGSSFFTMISRRDHLRMPYGAPPLSDDEIRVISKWINQGAKDN